MFLCQWIRKYIHKRTITVCKLNLINPQVLKILRKERIFSRLKLLCISDAKTLLFAPLRGSLTVEAAAVLPVFLLCMTAMLQYCNVMGTAAEFGAALCETGENMAEVAYVLSYTDHTEDISGAVQVAVNMLSDVYAKNTVMEKTGDTSAVKNVNMALSTILKEDDMINLVLTYQIKSPFGAVNLPGTSFIQKASLRAWVGRTDEDNTDESGSKDEVMVYVTSSGSVYHTTEDCSYLKLSIHTVNADDLSTLRNNSGGIYYPCELCGSDCGSTVYITNEGARYHSSVSCSGLKRTVSQVKLSELGDMRACSKCG